MNLIQKIRASHLNRHGFIDVTVGLVAFQAVHTTRVVLFGQLENEPHGETLPSMGKIIFLALVMAPYFENLLLIGLAGLHEKLFKRTGLFVLAPLLLTALHFLTPKEFPFPVFIRVLTLYASFYLFLKQYDLHKNEVGKHKALLMTSSIHFAMNATSILIVYLSDSYFAAETIFSAQPGE